MALAAAAALFAGSALTACDQTDAERDKDATPVVEYVRVTNPEAADSLLTSAPMGSQIVLMGHDLGAVQEIWFNDVKGKLNPTLITSFSIIVDVPSVIPEDVTDEITLVTSSGRRGVFNFHVTVPAPKIESMSCEYAKPGTEVTLEGDYFLDPVVIFPGTETPAEIVSFDQHKIVVKVPQGVEEGPMKVTSIYGTGKSIFNFMDSRGLICNFEDGYEHPWGGRGTVTTDADAVSGNYLLFDGTAAAWNWADGLMWGYWCDAANTHGNIPVAEGPIANLALKFETDIVTWTGVPMVFFFTKYGADDFNYIDDNPEAVPQAHWKPWFKAGEYVDAATGGWTTITIPLTDFKYNKEETETDRQIDDISRYTDLNIMLFGACEVPGPLTIKMDNIRVVAIK